MRECKIFIHRISELYKKDTTVYFSTISPREADLPPHKKSRPRRGGCQPRRHHSGTARERELYPRPGGKGSGLPTSLMSTWFMLVSSCPS